LLSVCSYLRIPARDDAIDNLGEIETAPRGLEHGAALLVPVVDGGRVEAHVVLVATVEPPVPRGDTEDVADAVELLEPDDELPQHGVEARAEPPAGDERGARAGRVDGEVPPGPRAAVGDERGRRRGGEVEEGVAEGDVPRGDVEGGRRVVVGVAGDGVRDRRGRGRQRRGEARHVAEGERRERHRGVGRGRGVGGAVAAAGAGGDGVHVSASERGRCCLLACAVATRGRRGTAGGTVEVGGFSLASRRRVALSAPSFEKL
jgi:hypothetical protein